MVLMNLVAAEPPSVTDQITWSLGTILSFLAIVGLLVRFALLPYLRDNLVDPVKQVNKQVSENAHQNTKPTVLDYIDNAGAKIDRVSQQVDQVQEQIKVMASMYEGHVNWSDRWVGLIERELENIRRDIKSHHPED